MHYVSKAFSTLTMRTADCSSGFMALTARLRGGRGLVTTRPLVVALGEFGPQCYGMVNSNRIATEFCIAGNSVAGFNPIIVRSSTKYK